LHTDLNKRFLNVAKDSYSMNGWPMAKRDFRTGDFFDVAGQLKRDDELFDCIFVDPPFFSVTPQGRVDTGNEAQKLLNKIRPLVAHEGRLVVVNNGVFVSGADFTTVIDALCADGYISPETRIDVPEDVTGTAATRQGKPLVDPAPFTHSTKMVVLKVTRKDGRSAAA
ncbi:MAG: class I SAM-dependent methyltransferase, partial [Archangium sp.]|nr:class I SAM-dependent methyltransferase [Archangium sp.]